MKLVLGSAAWRVRYGAFSKGPLSDNHIKDLALHAASLGFDFIDTAPTYGDTEEVIGRIKPKQSLATKVTVDTSNYSSIIKSIDRSRKSLGAESLDLVFIHNWDVLTETEKRLSAEMLQVCILNQAINSWGFSTYEVIELTKIENYGWSNLKIQINSNILDQRILELQPFLGSVDFKKLKSEIWVRSIFLQGVLLDETPRNPFVNHHDILNYFSLCKSLNTSPVEMCLAYVRQLEFIDGLVLGIENELQLDEIVKAFQIESPPMNFSQFLSRDINLIDPRNWNLNK